MKLTFELLHELLFYDEEDGRLYWRPRQRHHYKHEGRVHDFNKRFAGSLAGHVWYSSKDKTPYIIVHIFYQSYREHRLIWWMKTGVDHEDDLDHIDHDGTNNLWGNLRLADDKVNSKNMPLRKDNKTGYPGISFRGDKFFTVITVDKKTKYLGLFDNLEKAIAIRKEAEKRFGFHTNHGKK